MGIVQGACGCVPEVEGMEPWRSEGHQCHVMITACDYIYSPGNELSASDDKKSFEKLLSLASQSAEAMSFNILANQPRVLMDEKEKMGDRTFPTKENVLSTMQEVGRNCQPNDWFIFFYAGHGENVPDTNGDEETGLDEAYVTPGASGQLKPNMFLIDDDFADALENYIPAHANILVISDCCHSASIVDVNSRHWKQNHKVVAISACQDNQESADLGEGKGGLLTCSIIDTMEELGTKFRQKEYTIGQLYKKAYAKGQGYSRDQQMSMQYVNLDPETTAWPLCYSTWKSDN